MRVGIDVLEAFIVAAEEEHFGQAAKRLHLSQPALSRQVSGLEDEVGVKFFERVGRGVALTAAGTEMLLYAKRTVREYQAGVAAARRAASGAGGELRIGFVSPAIYANIVPKLVAEFRRRAPDVAVTLLERSSVPQAEGLLSGDLDVAFLHPPIPGVDIETFVLLRQRFVAALPASHPLSGESRIKAAQLANDPFVIFPRERGAGLYDQIITACQLAGFSPVVGQEATTMQTIVSLVAADIGVAIVPASLTQLAQEGVAFCELTDVDAEAALAAAWSPDSINPVLSKFLEVVREKGLSELPPRQDP